MQDVIRLKRLDERKEVNRQYEALSAGRGATENISEDVDGMLRNIDGLSRMTSRDKLRPEDIQQLEDKCQRMIFEKEDKYIEIESKLKQEDERILALEQELLEVE